MAAMVTDDVIRDLQEQQRALDTAKRHLDEDDLIAAQDLLGAVQTSLVNSQEHLQNPGASSRIQPLGQHDLADSTIGIQAEVIAGDIAQRISIGGVSLSDIATIAQHHSLHANLDLFATARPIPDGYIVDYDPTTQPDPSLVDEVTAQFKREFPHIPDHQIRDIVTEELQHDLSTAIRTQHPPSQPYDAEPTSAGTDWAIYTVLIAAITAALINIYGVAPINHILDSSDSSDWTTPYDDTADARRDAASSIDSAQNHVTHALDLAGQAEAQTTRFGTRFLHDSSLADTDLSRRAAHECQAANDDLETAVRELSR